MDRSRFSEYSGSPFYFKKNHEAHIYLLGEEKPYHVDEANFNLLTLSVEIYEKNTYVEIESSKIEKVIYDIDGVKATMTSDGKVKDGFIVNLYSSEQYSLFHHFYTKIEERSYNTPGKTIDKKIIRMKDKYILMNDGTKNEIDIKRKSILKLLGKKAEEICSKTKNKLKNEWQLIALLSALDEESTVD